MGLQYPENCVASHLNMVQSHQPPSFTKSPLLYIQHALKPYSKLEKEGMERTKWFRKEGSGYNLLQGTRPSTIGFALSDSPVALLAWIYEKLHDWTDSYPWTDDELLTWLSIYQFSTAGPAASARIYYERDHSQKEMVAKGLGYVPRVPIGLSYFPKDLIVPPTTWGRTLGRVVYEGVHSSGGHFAAHERPDELVEDMRATFSPFAGRWKAKSSL